MKPQLNDTLSLQKIFTMRISLGGHAKTFVTSPLLSIIDYVAGKFRRIY